MSGGLGESNEMFLLAVFRLTERGGEVSISRLAEVTGYGMSTVSEKARRLTEKGYLLHEWREAVSLSEDGRRYAGKLLRKRRLIETFLVRLAGYSVYDVYEDACRLEHVMSERLTNALERMLEYPRFDPHGHPIPDPDGTLARKKTTPLSLLDVGIVAEVASICGEDHERLKYIDELGFRPRQTVIVLNKAPFEGPVSVDIDGHRLSIAVSLASCIEMVVVSPYRTQRNGL